MMGQLMECQQAQQQVFQQCLQQQQLEVQQQQMRMMEHLLTIGQEKGQDGMPLSPYVEGEDIEAFLATFEKTMCLRENPVQEGVGCLVLLLTGSMRAAYNEVDVEATYPEVKQVILS